MPPRIDRNKCDGCATFTERDESFCEEACPGDLMYVGEDGKAHCHENRDCWDCMSCVKMCPRNAIETRVPYQIGYHKATLKPVMGKDFIVWKCVDLNGKEERYRFKNRLSAEDVAKIYGEK
jgi:adenylylsulfate reductase, subunit B